MSTMLEAALTTTEEAKVHTPEQEWSDSFAAKVVRADFEKAQEYRRYHDSRWELADRLYFGWEKQKTWEGTKIPRSSLGMFVVFQQIESLLPKVLSTIFSDTPWFEVTAMPQTSAKQAYAARDLLLYQLEQARRLENQSVREIFRRAIKSAFIYGNGIVELSWTDFIEKRLRHSRERIPETQKIPYNGSTIELPNGRYRYEVQQKTQDRKHQFPQLSYVSLKDFYIDPNCPGPQVQQARYAQKRALVTVDYLKSKRGQDGFYIPNDAELLSMAKHKSQRLADAGKASAEAARGNNWRPNEDTSLDPGAKLIELIVDYRKDRCVWLVNPGDMTEYVCYNEKNEFGFIPFFDFFYTDALDRFYGLSVTDVTEGEHRLQGAIVNARIDELALSIHAARIKKRGSSIPSYQLRRRPGQIIEAENPKDDIVKEEVQNVTQQAFIEVAASDGRVQKTTGITDLAVMGTPGGGGNSANRTATGIGVQTQAAFSRLTYIVENMEDNSVEPVLSHMHRLNTIFLDPDEIIPIVGQEIDPVEILNADVQFTMRASSKMQSRTALMQLFPPFWQTVMNPELMQIMSRQGKTFDLEEMFTVFLDVSGFKTKGRFIRPLTKEEQAAMQAAQSQEQNPEIQKQRERMASMSKMQEDQNEADMQQTIVDKAMDLAIEHQKPETAKK